MHVMECLGSMNMGSNQHYRWVLEVKWSTVVVSRTTPINGGQILTPPIYFGLCSINAIAQTKCRNIKLKTPFQFQRQVALNAIYKISIALSVSVLFLLIIFYNETYNYSKVII